MQGKAQSKQYLVSPADSIVNDITVFPKIYKDKHYPQN